MRERLKVSEKLVLLSSPSSAASKYVNLEVETFLESKPFEGIIIVLCRGELEESLPPRLKSIETEPLFIDLRNVDRKRFRLESLRLIAAIHGVEYADLRRVDEAARRHRRNGLILAAVVSLFLIASGYLITTTEPETWARVRQPSPRQEIMPVHAFAVNRKDPSILVYKGHDARWGSNPRPEGYSLKPSRRIANFQRRATQHLKTHLGSETLATLRFELESRHRSGSGLIAVHGIFDWEKKQLRYFRSLTYAGETAAGERKQLSIPPSLESVSDDPFDLSPWPMEMLKA